MRFLNQTLPAILATLVAWLWLMPSASAATAEALQSQESIQTAVRDYLLTKGAGHIAPENVEISRLDSRLKLQQCEQPLSTFTPPGGGASGRVSVGVRCEGGKPWTLYVSAVVSDIRAVAVAAHNIPRGTLIGPSDIRMEKKDLSNANGYITDAKAVVGKVSTRKLTGGRIISANHLSSANRVTKGDEVTIVSGSGSIEVRMKGLALDSGDPGQQIQVQNVSSGIKLQAEVLSANAVRAGI